MKALKDPELVKAVLADYRTAPVSERVRATLVFLEKLTLKPQSVTAADAAAARAAGVSDAALKDAVFICTLFCVIDRVADALGFVPSDPRALRWIPRLLLGPGYLSGVI